MKRVMYNGAKDSFLGCSNSANLVMGKVYEVVDEDIGKWQTNYVLKGVPGSYNSVWFDVIEQNIPEGIPVIAREVPKEGQSCHCSKMELKDGFWYLTGWKTSVIKSVREIVKDHLYRVTTQNNVYNVTVSRY